MTFRIGARVRCLHTITTALGDVMNVGDTGTAVIRHPILDEEASVIAVLLDKKNQYGDEVTIWDIACPWQCLEEIS